MRNYIAYYRVSTARQGRSGLGLAGQRTAVKNYTKGGRIVEEYTETESGTRKGKRVEIYKAIETAKERGAVLVVAKLDRLARNVEFTSALYNGGVEFVCCDNPNANKLTIQLLSVIAEHEADMIAGRIKTALEAKKQRIAEGNYINADGSKMKPVDGVYRLGNPNGWGEHGAKGAEARRRIAKEAKENVQATEFICIRREQGMTFQAIADKLNDLNYKTRKGNAYSRVQVKRLYDRYCKA